MPKGTKVEKVFTAVKKEGKDVSSAAAIAQTKTGQSLKTGKKIGGKGMKRITKKREKK